jgi:hypothetical protein
MVSASDFIASNNQSPRNQQNPTLIRYQNLSSANLGNNLKKDYSEIIDESRGRHTPVQKAIKKSKKKSKETPSLNSKTDNSASDPKKNSDRAVHKS